MQPSSATPRRWRNEARRHDPPTSQRRALNRRNFLKSAGALIVGFRMAGGEPPLKRSSAKPRSPARRPSIKSIPGSPSPPTAASPPYSGKEELGQGISTAQQQLVAEEFSVPFDRVKLIYCDTALTPDQAYTSGSQSHPANFNHANLAQACATAREALLKLASQRLGAPVDQLTAADGVISAEGDPSKKVTYAQLVGGKKLNLTLDKNAKRKTRQRMDRSRQTHRPSRHARHGHRPVRVCPQRAPARECCTAASCARPPSARH